MSYRPGPPPKDWPAVERELWRISQAIDEPQQSSTVTPQILSVSIVAGMPMVGQPYYAEVLVIGGTSPFNITRTVGNLPKGLTLRDGVISGTPTLAGWSDFTLLVTDDEDETYTASFALLALGRVSIVTEGLIDGSAGVAYADIVEVSGAVPPVAWEVEDGDLPGGLTLNAATGEITGTPLANDLSEFTIRVTDSLGQQDARSFSIAVSGHAIAFTRDFSSGLGSSPSFGRNSVAYYHDGSNVLQSAGVGTARFEDSEYLYEPEATNICPDSIIDTASSWSSSLSLTLAADTGPFNSATMTTINCNGGATQGANNTVVVTDDTDFVLSCYVSFKDNGVINRIGLYDSSQSWQGWAEITWASGTPTLSATGGGGLVGASLTSKFGDLYRVSVWGTTESGLATTDIEVQPDRNAGTGVGSYFGHVDLVLGTQVATTHIPTSGGSAIRYRDNLSYTLASDTTGMLILDATIERTDYADGGLITYSASDAGLLTINAYSLQMEDGTNTAILAGNDEIDSLRLFARWNAPLGVMQLGVKRAGFYLWGAEQDYDGAMPTDGSIHLGYGLTTVMRVAEVTVIDSDLGADWLEANY